MKLFEHFDSLNFLPSLFFVSFVSFVRGFFVPLQHGPFENVRMIHSFSTLVAQSLLEPAPHFTG